MGTGVFLGGKSGRGLKLTIRLNLVPMLRMSGTVPPFALYDCMTGTAKNFVLWVMFSFVLWVFIFCFVGTYICFVGTYLLFCGYLSFVLWVPIFCFVGTYLLFCGYFSFVLWVPIFCFVVTVFFFCKLYFLNVALKCQDMYRTTVCLLFCVGVKLGRLHSWSNIGRGYLRIGC